MILEPLPEKYARLTATRSGVSRVGWQDNLQQAVQFEMLLNLQIPINASVLDAGCGVGDLLPPLIERGFAGPYTGLDMHPPFLAEAESRFAARPPVRFLLADARFPPVAPHDFIFASGLFDYKTEAAAHWAQTIRALAAKTTRALAWNGYYRLPARRSDMWAVSLPQVTALCQSLSPYWQLRADYAPGHYTAVVFKPAYWLTPALQTLIGHLFLDESLRARIKNQPETVARRYGLSIQQLNFLDPLL